MHELWVLACRLLLWSLNGPANLMEAIMLENSISKSLLILFCRCKLKYKFDDSCSCYWLVMRCMKLLMVFKNTLCSIF